MQIAVLSGKGGTGKTLVSVNLAAVASPALYVDCDVEEPNGHLFFRPQDVHLEAVPVTIPQVTGDCVGCRACVNVCQFHALAFLERQVMVFPELCHSCGGCVLVCPQQALTETERIIGTLQTGQSQGVTVFSGVLNPGEVSGVPIVGRLRQAVLAQSTNKETNVFLDCPPGSACLVMASIQDADYCLLVAEPTRFSVHNLELVCQLVELFHKPYGVILNKWVAADNPAARFCAQTGAEVVGCIPFDPDLARLHTNGKIAVREDAAYRCRFTALLHTIIEEVNHETALAAQR